MKLDLNAAMARILAVPETNSVGITLVGCGGSGSWLAPHVARIAKLWRDLNPDRNIKLVFYDGDHVEEKNTYRQNFTRAEIGSNKAEALARRFTFVYGLEVHARPHFFTDLHFEDRRDLNIILGCVDGPDGRVAIDRVIYNGRNSNDRLDLWIDCGNHKWSGQVLLSTSITEVPPFSLQDRCLWVPSPRYFHPELFEKDKEPRKALRQDVSCAELAMMDHQSMSINAMVASIAADYLVQILLTKNVTRFATYFNLEGNLPFNHKYLVPKEFDAILRQNGRRSKKGKNRGNGA